MLAEIWSISPISVSTTNSRLCSSQLNQGFDARIRGGEGTIRSQRPGHQGPWHRLLRLFTKTHTAEPHRSGPRYVQRPCLTKATCTRKGTLQYFCPKCAKFLPDRYVEGTCKKCGNTKSRGDQCEACGSAHEAGELESTRCTICGTQPELRKTEHFFLKLSEFQQPLLDLCSTGRTLWRPNVPAVHA